MMLKTLKVRAYPVVFPRPRERDFAEAVHRFELDLDERTEDHRNDKAGGGPSNGKCDQQLDSAHHNAPCVGLTVRMSNFIDLRN